MPENTRRSLSTDLAVIGIGASAGGLDAATRLLEVWSDIDHLAFILVQHADPAGGSMLATLLSPHTALVVQEAAEGMLVEAGHLYIIPPGRYLSTQHGVLHVSAPPARHAARAPFDFLLQALAVDYAGRAACVVLSGTGADGSVGLVAIKAHGGVVAVQDPLEASYDGMPTNAIATGLADIVLPLTSLPRAVREQLRSGKQHAAVFTPAAKAAAGPDSDGVGVGVGDVGDTGAPGFSDASLASMVALLRGGTGNDFSLYKPGTLKRRIRRRIVLSGLEPQDTRQYIEVLRDDIAELQALAGDLLIHVTCFFRDDLVFDTLATSTIPELVASHPAGRSIRVWVVGCSSGEETYSLAILFLEQIELSGRKLKLQIFASDKDPDAIAAARDGSYQPSIADSVTPMRLARFFVHQETGWRVAADVRATVVFAVQDVLADPPFSRLDMVSCRNLLIYLRPDAQARVVDAFHFALREGGILLLGSAETVIAPEGRFETLSKPGRIYRRIGRGSITRLATPPRPALLRPGEARQTRPASTTAVAVRPTALAELSRRLVMEAYAPAAVLVDAANIVLFCLGPTDLYLRLPQGHATQDLLAMTRPGLRATLRAALQTARESRTMVATSGWLAGKGQSEPVRLDIHPVLEAGQTLLLVCFLQDVSRKPDIATTQSPTQSPRLAELQRELDATRTELQGTVRDLELSGQEQRAINEEALSVNEEYQSANEELVASKEELQSLNEELTAVNSQLQETLERQRTTSDDLQNVLFSTNVATLFLDLSGRIRFFTPAIRTLFAVIPQDVGRMLTDFKELAPDSALIADLDAVRNGRESPDREIEAADGNWFRRRVLPYRAGDGRVEGVVITFIDITARKAAARALEAAKTEAETASAAKSRFLAAASHDLRQPLQTLSLLQALLADTVDGPKAQDLIARQTVTLGTITGMLDTLLDINEIEAGVVQPAPTVFNVGTLLERLGTEFAYHAEAKGVRLRVVACSQAVNTDMRLLEQIVRNLLSNAIKYTSHGRVLLGCRRHGDRISVEVWDTGVGIADADLLSIFDEHFQVDNPARQRSRGLGLGLSIVRRLGDLLRHPIQVRSRLGAGTMFSILLPRASAPGVLGPDAAAPAVLDVGRGKLRILVVEDDPDVMDGLCRLLLAQGLSVTGAADGPTALEAIRHAVPDLVLADYNLPNGPNGLELAASIRAAARRQVPVLILTGDVSSATIRNVAEAGCDIIMKPASRPALREAIARLVAPPRSRRRPLIGVIDDDDDVRGAIMAVLSADGRSIVGYPSAEAFLQAAVPDSVDVLLVDAVLPGISGIDLLERLRAEGHVFPVIVFTGQSDVAMAIRAMKAGASDFIEKPVARNILLTSLVHALDGSRDAATITARREGAVAHLAALTPRQREIMGLVLAGQPSKNIAVDLGISQRTVENHRASIMHRTGATSLPALARLALAASDVPGGKVEAFPRLRHDAGGGRQAISATVSVKIRGPSINPGRACFSIRQSSVVRDCSRRADRSCQRRRPRRKDRTDIHTTGNSRDAEGTELHLVADPQERLTVMHVTMGAVGAVDCADCTGTG